MRKSSNIKDLSISIPSKDKILDSHINIVDLISIKFSI